MSLLNVEGLSAYYDSVPALRGISLAIEPGEAVGLGGANGAGKSTLLKALVGMVSTRGGISFDGQRVERRPTAWRIRSGMVYVPQEHMVVGGVSVRENLRLFWLAGDRATGFEESVAKVFEAFPELARREATEATSLSGGERQMLAMSRAFVTTAPKLVLLDEPSAGLAPLVVERIAELIEGWREQGLTFLLLEQNERLLERCCERSLRLASGELWTEEEAPPAVDAGAGAEAKQKQE